MHMCMHTVHKRLKLLKFRAYIANLGFTVNGDNYFVFMDSLQIFKDDLANL